MIISDVCFFQEDVAVGFSCYWELVSHASPDIKTLNTHVSHIITLPDEHANENVQIPIQNVVNLAHCYQSLAQAKL